MNDTDVKYAQINKSNTNSEIEPRVTLDYNKKMCHFN